MPIEDKSAANVDSTAKAPAPNAPYLAPVPAVADDGGLDKLPEGAVLVDTVGAAAHAGSVLHRPVPAFSDEHVGVGGSYVIDANGDRQRAYEKYTDGDGKTKYRPKL